ncbi:MAG TPA: M24 family metallopeptidase [Solirubrobacteraceae bacterium]|nr:M24 family metallopeptidase [Solirubrobacteraceae bacterium]
MSALLLFGDTERSPAMRHEVPIAIGDGLLFAEVDGRAAILTSWLERGRIAAVLPEAELLDFVDLGMRALVEDGMTRLGAEREVVLRAVRQLGIGAAVIPGDFPVAIADRLRADGIALTIDDDAVAARRRVKEGAELKGIRAAQRAAHAATARASELLARAEVGADGNLRGEDGGPLLAEAVREELRRTCAQHGATCPADMIVASIHNGGGGHEPGSGPLPSGLPIQVDIFPRHEASACWADMTRTFVAGEPSAEHAELISEQERLVRAALDEARAAVRPGVTGRELHDATCDLFEAAGWATQRTGGGEEGFQFALGHGVGLEVHEPPGLGFSGREPFIAGDVVAIEPGLWDKRIGGVRLEDLLLVTPDGCETLTDYPYELTPRA